jgi:prepilin-type N-terminal cleavage/methylation domain-containing protein
MRLSGFTLAELLIALLILGEIATFTIPKILTSQQNNRYNATGKEVAATIAAAYQQALLAGTVTTNTTPGDLTPYMNYVSVDTTSSVDWQYTGSTTDCTTVRCLKLHNGGILHYTSIHFYGTNTTNAIYFYFDPDGTTDGTTTNAGKAVLFFLYYNGRITSWSNAAANTSANGATYGPLQVDPPWFKW